MDAKLTLAISPCPNDTYIFDAWINAKIPNAPSVNVTLLDIAQLNHQACQTAFDVIKVSGRIVDAETLTGNHG